MLKWAAQMAFAKILKERGHKGPLKYVEGICVERVGLGKQPPLLRMVRAQSSPADNLLRLDFGVGFAPAEGFSVVVGALAGPVLRDRQQSPRCTQLQSSLLFAD